MEGRLILPQGPYIAEARGQTASIRSAFMHHFHGCLAVIPRRTSTITIGRTPGFLSKGISLQINVASIHTQIHGMVIVTPLPTVYVLRLIMVNIQYIVISFFYRFLYLPRSLDYVCE